MKKLLSLCTAAACLTLLGAGCLSSKPPMAPPAPINQPQPAPSPTPNPTPVPMPYSY